MINSFIKIIKNVNVACQLKLRGKKKKSELNFNSVIQGITLSNNNLLRQLISLIKISLPTHNHDSKKL